MKFEKQKKQTAKELDERKIGDSERTKKELKPDHLLSNSNDILSERGAPKIEIVSFNVFFFVCGPCQQLIHVSSLIIESIH